MRKTIVVAPARPEETVTVTEDEVRRSIRAIQASGLSIYLKPGDPNRGPDIDEVCMEDMVVGQIFK